MKIAVYHNLPSGGAKRMMYEVLRRLTGRHEFHVFTYSTADHQFADIRPYVKTHTQFEVKPARLFRSPFGRLNQGVRLRNLRRMIAMDKTIARQIDSQDYDLLWVNPCQVQNSPSVLRHVQHTPTIFLCQEPLRILYESMPSRPYDQKQNSLHQVLDWLDPLRSGFFRALKANDRANIHNAGLVLANSNFMRNSISSIYALQPQTAYAGVDHQFFSPDHQPRGDFLLSVGSLTPLKGFDFLIRAIATLPSDFRPRLVIASNFENAPEKAYLTQTANETGVQVEFLLGISDQLLKDLYNQARLTVYAPIREPFGLVALESMACGTPVIGVAEGGLQETIRHQETGFLTARNEQEFGAAIQTLYHDERKLKDFGRAGREWVAENWSWDKVASRFELHFQHLEA